MLSKTESQRCFHNACLYTIHNFKELEFKCFYFQTFSSKLLEFLIVKFSSSSSSSLLHGGYLNMYSIIMFSFAECITLENIRFPLYIISS